MWNELDQSSIMSVEFIAAILVWGGAGLALDHWLGTGPWLMGFGVILGFAAGLYLIWLRSAEDLQHRTNPTPRRPHGAHDEHEREGW